MRRAEFGGILIVSCALLPVTAGARAQDADDDAEKPFPSKRTREELVQAIFGQNREERRKAANEAIYAMKLTEDDWIRLLETSFSTDDEQEEAKYYAGMALGRTGTVKALPYLKKLRDDEPKCVDVVDGKRIARYGFRFEAINGINRLQLDVTMLAVLEKIKDLAPADKADAMARMFAENEKSFAAFRPEGFPEGQASAWWRLGLAYQLGQLGAPGAWGFAHAVEKESDPETRANLCLSMADNFVRGKHVDPKVRDDPQVREAEKTALKAVLKAEKHHRNEAFAFWLPGPAMKDLEAELIDFVRRTDLRGLTARDDPRPVLLEKALNAIAECGSESAFDFLVNDDDGPRFRMPLPHNDAIVRRLVAALQKEPENTLRFGCLVGELGSTDENAPSIDLGSLDAVRMRVKTGLAEHRYPSEERQVTGNLASLERVLERVREKKAELDRKAGGR